MIANSQLVKVLLNDWSAVLVAHDFANSVLFDNPSDLLADPLEPQRCLLRSRPTRHPVDNNRSIGRLVQDGQGEIIVFKCRINGGGVSSILDTWQFGPTAHNARLKHLRQDPSGDLIRELSQKLTAVSFFVELLRLLENGRLKSRGQVGRWQLPDQLIEFGTLLDLPPQDSLLSIGRADL